MLQFYSTPTSYCLEVDWNTAFFCRRCVTLAYVLLKWKGEFRMNVFWSYLLKKSYYVGKTWCNLGIKLKFPEVRIWIRAECGHQIVFPWKYSRVEQAVGVLALKPLFRDNRRRVARNSHWIQSLDRKFSRIQSGSGYLMIEWEDNIQTPLSAHILEWTSL